MILIKGLQETYMSILFNSPQYGKQLDAMMYDRHSGVYIPLHIADQHNKIVDIINKFNKNYKENQDFITINQIQSQLSKYSISYNPFQFEELDIATMDMNLYDTARALVSDTKTSIQSAVILILTQVLVATQGNIYVNIEEGHDEFPSIYAFLADESGSRKSVVIKKIIHPFEEFVEEIKENEIDNDVKQAIASEIKRNVRKTIAPLIDELLNSTIMQNSDSINEKIMRLSQGARHVKNSTFLETQDFLVESCTSAGLLSTLSKNNGHLAVVSAEGAIINCLLKDKELFSHFKQGYDFEDIHRATSRNKISIHKPSLNLSLYVQPSEIIKIVENKEMQNQGFTARCIFLLNYKQAEHPRSGNLNFYNQKISQLLQNFYCDLDSRKIHKVETTHEAVKELKNFEEMVEKRYMPTFPERSVPALKKLHGLAARFALAYHIWSNEFPTSETLSLPTMQVGIKIAMSLLEQIYFTYHEYGLTALPMAKKINDYFHKIDVNSRKSILQEGIDMRRIASCTHLTMAKVERGIGYLQRCNALRLYDNGSTKRKVILHPYFYAYDASKIHIQNIPISVNRQNSIF